MFPVKPAAVSCDRQDEPYNHNGDRRLIALIDASMSEAAERAGQHLACRIGCTECCVGPFPITPLDAMRLRRALLEVAVHEPSRAARIRERARGAVEAMQTSFPGDPEGILRGDEAAEEAFLATCEALPCPVLDPDSGHCELYEARPISCRTFGPPVQIGESRLPPCRLCFTTASPTEIENARIVIDRDDREDELLRELEAAGATGETFVAFALAARIE